LQKITWALIHDCKFNEKIGNIFLVQIFNNRFLQVDGLKRQVLIFTFDWNWQRERDFSQKSSNLKEEEALGDKSQMFIS